MPVRQSVTRWSPERQQFQSRVQHALFGTSVELVSTLKTSRCRSFALLSPSSLLPVSTLAAVFSLAQPVAESVIYKWRPVLVSILHHLQLLVCIHLRPSTHSTQRVCFSDFNHTGIVNFILLFVPDAVVIAACPPRTKSCGLVDTQRRTSVRWRNINSNRTNLTFSQYYARK